MSWQKCIRLTMTVVMVCILLELGTQEWFLIDFFCFFGHVLVLQMAKLRGFSESILCKYGVVLWTHFSDLVCCLNLITTFGEHMIGFNWLALFPLSAIICKYMVWTVGSVFLTLVCWLLKNEKFEGENFSIWLPRKQKKRIINIWKLFKDSNLLSLNLDY